jgi:hypothetical protein
MPLGGGRSIDGMTGLPADRPVSGHGRRGEQRWRGVKQIARQNEASGEPKPTQSPPPDGPAGTEGAGWEPCQSRAATLSSRVTGGNDPYRQRHGDVRGALASVVGTGGQRRDRAEGLTAQMQVPT